MISKSFFSERKIIAIASTVFLMAVSTIFFGNRSSVIKKDNVIDQNVAAVSQRPNTAKGVEASDISESKNVSSVKATENSPIVWIDSEEQKHELELWKLSRGEMKITYTDDYDRYDKATLQALATNNHDIKAMTTLGRDLPGEEGMKWLNVAAIYGSSFAFALAAGKSIGIHSTEPVEIKKIALIDALVYKKIAELRNDFYSARFVTMSTFEFNLGMVLSDEDKQLAEKRSHDLYSELEAQRVQLGLGKFDNSIPPVVQAYFEYIKPYYR